MELRHLRYFVAVADERHVTRAAERLGIQQPPLSQQIQALEAELGLKLFRRLPRGVELTEAGLSFYRDALEILDRVKEAESKAHRTARGELGRVVVGFTSSSPLNSEVPAIIRDFREKNPFVSMNLVEDATGALIEGIRNDTIDAAFIRSPAASFEGLTIYPLLQEDMIAALPKHSNPARASGKSIPLKMLAEAPFVLYRRQAGPGLYDLIISSCRRAGFSPNIVQEAPQIVSTLNLVAAGLGVSIVPRSMMSLRMPGIIFRKLETSGRLSAPLNLACRKSEHSAAAKNFVQLARRTIGAKRGA